MGEYRRCSRTGKVYDLASFETRTQLPFVDDHFLPRYFCESDGGARIKIDLLMIAQGIIPALRLNPNYISIKNRDFQAQQIPQGRTRFSCHRRFHPLVHLYHSYCSWQLRHPPHFLLQDHLLSPSLSSP